MSRFKPHGTLFGPSFPRVSGDEPLDAIKRARLRQFSPRERG